MSIYANKAEANPPTMSVPPEMHQKDRRSDGPLHFFGPGPLAMPGEYDGPMARDLKSEAAEGMLTDKSNGGGEARTNAKASIAARQWFDTRAPEVRRLAQDALARVNGPIRQKALAAGQRAMRKLQAFVGRENEEMINRFAADYMAPVVDTAVGAMAPGPAGMVVGLLVGELRAYLQDGDHERSLAQNAEAVALSGGGSDAILGAMFDGFCVNQGMIARQVGQIELKTNDPCGPATPEAMVTGASVAAAAGPIAGAAATAAASAARPGPTSPEGCNLRDAPDDPRFIWQAMEAREQCESLLLRVLEKVESLGRWADGLAARLNGAIDTHVIGPYIVHASEGAPVFRASVTQDGAFNYVNATGPAGKVSTETYGWLLDKHFHQLPRETLMEITVHQRGPFKVSWRPRSAVPHGSNASRIPAWMAHKINNQLTRQSLRQLSR